MRRSPSAHATVPDLASRARRPLHRRIARLRDRPATVEDRRRCTLHESPVAQDRDLTTHRQRLCLVVGDQHRGGPLVGESLQHRGSRSRPGGAASSPENGSSSSTSARPRRECPCQRHPPLFSSGQLVRSAVRVARGRGRRARAPRRHASELLRSLRGRPKPTFARHVQVRDRGLPPERRNRFRASRAGGAVPPSATTARRRDASLVRSGEPHDHPQQRGLAASGGTEDRRQGPFGYHEVDVAQHRRGPVGRGHVLAAELSHRRAPSPVLERSDLAEAAHQHVGRQQRQADEHGRVGAAAAYATVPLLA